LEGIKDIPFGEPVLEYYDNLPTDSAIDPFLISYCFGAYSGESFHPFRFNSSTHSGV
jgi:hypothetical protein